MFLGCCSKNGQYGLFSPSRGGLDLLDLKHGNVVKTLIPKVAEGINNVIAKFNETDEHVLYYHSGHKTLRVFRVTDGEMIADYRVPSNLTSLESTTDGNHVALGMVDGNISILTIADPRKPKMENYLRCLPSRQVMQAVITTGCRVKKVAIATNCATIFQEKVDDNNSSKIVDQEVDENSGDVLTTDQESKEMSKPT